VERLAALAREVEGDVRLVVDRLIEALLRVLDVGARQARAVAQDPVAIGRRGLRVGLLVAQDQHAGRTSITWAFAAFSLTPSRASSAAWRVSND
jgi:hypothetical protein